MSGNQGIDNLIYIIFGRIARKKMKLKRFKWRENNPDFTTGLILDEGKETHENIPYSLEEIIMNSYDPMCWGYAMHLFLRKEIETATPSIISKLNDYSKLKKPKSFKLVSPLKFISKIPYHKFQDYKSLYDKIIDLNKKNIINPNKAKNKTKHDGEDAEQFLNQVAYDFCYKYVWKKYSTRRKVKWSADPLKMEYYHSQWKTKIQCFKGKDEYNEKEGFFDILLTEMKDADSKAAIHLKKREKQRRRAFFLPILSAVLSSTVASINSLFKDFFDSNNPSVKWVKIGLITMSFLISGATAWVLAIKDKGKEDEEVWLRQRLFYFNLNKEIEVFFNNDGDYKNEPDECKKINAFMKNIAQIRQKDWDNFFRNMNCRNYEN